jgi:hypothetical protein
MDHYKIAFGLAGSVIGIISYAPYFRDMLRRSTKPHPFSWFVWGLVSSIAFYAQIISGGGIGAWTTGITAFACLSIACFAVFLGERRITRLDIICFIGALAGIVAWRITHDPLNAVLIVLVVHILGFIPTVRKAYRFPREETLVNYVLSLFKWGFGLAALSTLSLTTVLFPAGVSAMNLAFSILLLVCRRQSAV